MPVTKLMVEGKLDGVLLEAVLKGRPPIVVGGSKTGLKSNVEAERRSSRTTTICYIRDRDFDFEPPEDRSRPEVHARGEDGHVVGWYWCRHEMESYLLEPAIVERAIGCDVADYRAALTAAARHIRDYQAARGAIGVTRRSLPPNFKFQTLPREVPDDSLRLPKDLSAEGVTTWARDQASQFRDRICPQLDPDALTQVINRRRAALSDEKLDALDEILVWFSGKDLMGALSPWLAERGITSAGTFRARLRDWVRDNPEDTVSLLPEWKTFIAMLSQ